jgi:high affinity Mn2+ porin
VAAAIMLPATRTSAQPSDATPPAGAPPAPQSWNWHIQNTGVVQGDPRFPAKYSGVNSLDSNGEIRETITLDLFLGRRLWRGAEAHVDGLMWQGFGLSKTFGIEDFPNGDAYKAGTKVPNFTFARVLVRQTIGFGGEKEEAPDDPLTLAGELDVSRLTITVGRFTPKDVMDSNAYANDPHRQFMNWTFMGNVTWDYGQDTVGYSTGIAVELNQRSWALRYVFFQMPREKNGFTTEDELLLYPTRGADGPFLKSWAMAFEYERRYSIHAHPGALRFMAWLNEADMASYQAALPILRAKGPGADISAARAFRYKYGFGLNWEQEVARNVGVFSRIGSNDGHSETWTFTDVNCSASLGVSVKGEWWRRPEDTLGLAGVVSGASASNRAFLEAGGTDILDGDGKLNYGWEKLVELYYDAQIWRMIHGALDYQFVDAPAFNRDRGPVSIFGARLRWAL